MFFSRSESVQDENFLRAASPNERRSIIRESLDFYRTLIIGGVYEFSEPRDVTAPSTYAYAVRKSIEQHPFLATLTRKADTERPYFAFCPQLDLRDHIQIKPLQKAIDHETLAIEELLQSITEQRWSHLTPSWKIVVLPFSQTRCFIAFSYSHGWSDGMCAIAFHRTFLAAMQEKQTEHDLLVTPQRNEIAEAFDTPSNLPITWSFLLSPLLGAYMPKAIASIFGLKASASEVHPGTWTGSSVFMHEEYRTMVQLISIDSKTLSKTLIACRENGSKLTGLIHQLIVNALSANLPSSIDSLSSVTAINLRSTINVSNDTMGMFVSGDFNLHSRTLSNALPADEPLDWDKAREITEKLASSSKDLVNQPVGLLRYLSDIRGWMTSKLGERRDGSYEVSNLVAFKPIKEDDSCVVSEMVFCQPANVYGAPLLFNVVSVRGGPLNVAISWQPGAVGMESLDEENEFVRQVSADLKRGFGRVSERVQS